jgi:hypothetical protein
MSSLLHRAALAIALLAIAALGGASQGTIARQLGLSARDIPECQPCVARSASHVAVTRQVLAREIHSRLVRDGGCTLDPRTAQSVGQVDAYAVSRAGYEMRLAELPTAHEIEQYLASHELTLASEGIYVGAWRDDASGAYYLDLSELIRDRALAEASGRAQRQQCIYHLATGSEIRLK